MAAGRRGPNKKPGPKTKSKWKDEFIKQVGPLIRSGMKRKEIYDFFNISKETFNKWRHENKRFSDQITKAQDYIDSKDAERSLKQRVKGFRYTEQTQEFDKDGNIISTRKTRKRVVPDVPAIKFLLTNRAAKRWQDKQEHNINGEITHLAPKAVKKPKDSGK